MQRECSWLIDHFLLLFPSPKGLIYRILDAPSRGEVEERSGNQLEEATKNGGKNS